LWSRFLIINNLAPISSEVVDFMRICFGAQFVEGYGQTETTGAATTGISSDPTAGHVGVPFPTCMVKLRDVKAMNYTSKDKPFPRGEVCIKGNNCFSGILLIKMRLL
jgi:long-chain acyl-CoA synthetase